MPDKQSRNDGVMPRGEKWVARPYITGHGHVWVGTFDDEDLAIEEADRVRDELRTLPPSRETIRSFKNRWIKKPEPGSEEWRGDYPRKKPSTNENYEREAERFAKLHGDTRVRDFKRIDARRLAREIPGMAQIARAMFSDMMDEGLINENVFFGLKSINKGGEQGRRNIVVVTAAELELLVQIAKDAHPDYDFWQIVVLAAEVGWRPSEAWGTERTNFAVAAEEVTIRRQIYKGRMQTPKNDRERTVILTPDAAAAYETLPRYSPLVLVDERGRKRQMDLAIRNKSGKPMGPTTLHHYWEVVRTTFEASLDPERRDEFREARDPAHPKMDFYELRHFCATKLLELFRENGEDGCADVAIQLGHTDEGELVRGLYGHPDDALARKRLKRLFKKPDVQPLRPVEDKEASNG